MWWGTRNHSWCRGRLRGCTLNNRSWLIGRLWGCTHNLSWQSGRLLGFRNCGSNFSDARFLGGLWGGNRLTLGLGEHSYSLFDHQRALFRLWQAFFPGQLWLSLKHILLRLFPGNESFLGKNRRYDSLHRCYDSRNRVYKTQDRFVYSYHFQRTIMVRFRGWGCWLPLGILVIYWCFQGGLSWFRCVIQVFCKLLSQFFSQIYI